MTWVGIECGVMDGLPGDSVDAVGVLFEGSQGAGLLEVPQLYAVIPAAAEEQVLLYQVP